MSYFMSYVIGIIGTIFGVCLYCLLFGGIAIILAKKDRNFKIPLYIGIAICVIDLIVGIFLGSENSGTSMIIEIIILGIIWFICEEISGRV